MPFRDYLQKLAPTSLKRKLGGLFFKGVGEAFDGSADGVVRAEPVAPATVGDPLAYHVNADATRDLVDSPPAPDYGVVERVKLAVKARFPDQEIPDPNNPGQFLSNVPDDALNATASERGLERGLLSSLNLGIRLRQAWSTWTFGGTPYGLLRELWVLGYQNVHLAIVNGKVYRMQSNTGVPGDGTVGNPTSGDLVISNLPAGSWWPSSGDHVPRRWWTYFAVIFDSPLPQPPVAPSDWTVALPASSSAEVEAIRRVIKRWKPAFAICDGIFVLTSGWLIGWPTTITLGQVGLANLGAPAGVRWSP